MSALNAPQLAPLLLLLLAAVPVSSIVDRSTCPICEGGAVGAWNASISLTVSPVANPPATSAALSVEGTTEQDDQREFLVNLGLRSDRGAKSRPTPYHDKVTLWNRSFESPIGFCKSLFLAR